MIHASGTPEGLELALQVAGNEARIVELSWFGSRTVALPLGGAFPSRRLDNRLVTGGPVAPQRSDRDGTTADAWRSRSISCATLIWMCSSQARATSRRSPRIAGAAVADARRQTLPSIDTPEASDPRGAVQVALDRPEAGVPRPRP